MNTHSKASILLILGVSLLSPRLGVAGCEIKDAPVRIISKETLVLERGLKKGQCAYGNDPSGDCLPPPTLPTPPAIIVKDGRVLGTQFPTFDLAVQYFEKHLKNVCSPLEQAPCSVQPGKIIVWPKQPAIGPDGCYYGSDSAGDCLPPPTPPETYGWRLIQGDRVVVTYLDKKTAELGLERLVGAGYCGIDPANANKMVESKTTPPNNLATATASNLLGAVKIPVPATPNQPDDQSFCYAASAR